MGFRTVSAIVFEVCTALWNHMQPLYMPEPTEEIWEKSINGFYEKRQFPNCLGSIVGKHITIKCPDKTGSNYFCYLQKFSFVLLAIVYYDYKFICLDVGGYGRNSDGGLFEQSIMGQRLDNKTFNVPKDKPLPFQDECTLCVLVGEKAFPLKKYLMRPFPHRQSKSDLRKEVFNKRLCRARRVVENAFGMLSNKWRLLFRPIEVKVETAIIIVKTVCVLHNYLLIKQCDLPSNLLEENEAYPGTIRNRNDNRRSTNTAFQIRQRFVSFFNDNN
ncbi:uncharacterized protein [Leptinotarsa decemlineata]|uniref:uncharacterized protein n=1 Tax=Leptinotarsa decemlineata TaxID=7539 RepID=UPI003D30706D